MRNRFGSNRRSFSRARSARSIDFEELEEDFDNIGTLLVDAIEYAWEEEEEDIDSPLTTYLNEIDVEIDLSRVYKPLSEGVNAADNARYGGDTELPVILLDRVKDSVKRLLKEHQSIWRRIHKQDHLASVSFFMEWYDELMKFERKLARM